MKRLRYGEIRPSPKLPSYLGEELSGKVKHFLILKLVMKALMPGTFPINWMEYYGYSTKSDPFKAYFIYFSPVLSGGSCHP